MERVYGPYERNGKWKVIVERAEDRRRVSCTFETYDAALACRNEELAKIEGRTLSTVVDEYLDHLRAQGNRVHGVEAMRYKLRAIFRLPHEDCGLAALTTKRAEELYAKLVDTVVPRTKRKVAAWSHHKALGFAKQFGSWARSKGYLAENPFAEVKTVGALPSGNTRVKLRITETSKLLTVCLADPSPRGAFVAVLIVTGARVSEVLERDCRDLDAGGSILWIDEGKTAAAARPLTIPLVPGDDPLLLRKRLLAQVTGESRWLWGTSPSKAGHKTRGWAKAAIRHCCRQAGVMLVSAHAFRRTFATLARINGVAAQTVANAIGHGGTSEQDRSYVSPGSQSLVDTLSVTELLLRAG